MNVSDIVRHRLHNQLLTRTIDSPADVVGWLGAVQAQDYLGALWAVGQRASAKTQSDVERAIADRQIVRTWPMRGTLHFVAPEDARWMLALLTPRVIARAAGRYRQLGLDDAIFARSESAVVRALEGGRQLTRSATYAALEAAGVSTEGQRGLHILGWLAQKGVVCFGTREGKQHTFALLDEWVTSVRAVDREWCLAELARRYFASHGPATLHDFAWWSGLTLGEVREGVALVERDLERAAAGGATYWLAPPEKPAPRPRPTVHLLPVYDEYAVAYRDRSAILDPAYAEQAKNGIFNSVVTANGRIVGTWTRAFSREGVTVTTSLFEPLGAGEARALEAATRRYTAFVQASAAS